MKYSAGTLTKNSTSTISTTSILKKKMWGNSIKWRVEGATLSRVIQRKLTISTHELISDFIEAIGSSSACDAWIWSKSADRTPLELEAERGGMRAVLNQIIMLLFGCFKSFQYFRKRSWCWTCYETGWCTPPPILIRSPNQGSVTKDFHGVEPVPNVVNVLWCPIVF